MKKRILGIIACLIIACIVTIFYCDRIVVSVAKGNLFSSVDSLPYNRVGLLLGTSKFLRHGTVNPYYEYRIDAAYELIASGKVQFLIISGDNSRKSYNEPQMMKTDLARLGVDSTKLFLDYAGFRTFDSMVRLREIFSQDSVTIISQKFHNERALYIASREGIAAIAFNAKDVPADLDIKVKVREKFARVKVFADYLFGVDPKFLGEKVTIPSK